MILCLMDGNNLEIIYQNKSRTKTLKKRITEFVEYYSAMFAIERLPYNKKHL